MRFVGDDGITPRDVVRLARTKTNFRGLHRWGYITLKPPEGRADAPHAEWIIRPTRAGKQAQTIWRGLLPEIEVRWRDRFGAAEIDKLQRSLSEIVSQLELELPDCLPIPGYGLWTAGPKPRWRSSGGARVEEAKNLPLYALLSKALLAFAIEFEKESDVSLAISANVLRVMSDQRVRVRDLPRSSGVSKEAIAMALGVLVESNFATEHSDYRARLVRLTTKGHKAEKTYQILVRQIEERWKTRFGGKTIEVLRVVLQSLAADGTAPDSPLFRGLIPYPDGWRAAVKPPETLPHFPMVLHRGGYPDGS